MKKIPLILILLLFQISNAQVFKPVPQDLKDRYTFDFEKNFYPNEGALKNSLQNLRTKIQEEKILIEGGLNSTTLVQNMLIKYDSIERIYRRLDLYYFLKYAIDTRNDLASNTSDSIRAVIRSHRNLVKRAVMAMSTSSVKELLQKDASYSFFINSSVSEGEHILSDLGQNISSNFDYLKNNTFYDEAFNKIVFEKIILKDEEIDVIREMGKWENHPDSLIRNKGEELLFAGYDSQKNAFGYGYINYIRGLDAFSKAKGFKNLLEEKEFYNQLPAKSIENIILAILSTRATEKSKKVTIIQNPKIQRYTIMESTDILNSALSVLGPEYKRQLQELLSPKNGRIDIVGGENRIPIRGAASAFPIFPSIFYAYNYEGYPLDLVLLAHEAGHAVQASLMYENKVKMVYASGPAYFTESFGKFNELLVYNHLYLNSKEKESKASYRQELWERMNVLYGSAEEAYIEYFLIKGIIDNKINTPLDLDNETYRLGLAFNPNLYERQPFRKGLWMLMDSSFREPLQNVHDMLASALSVEYFKRYVLEEDLFLKRYNRLLKMGYDDTPENMLRILGIDINNEEFIGDVTKFIDSY